jgi:hypothetical protein
MSIMSFRSIVCITIFITFVNLLMVEIIKINIVIIIIIIVTISFNFIIIYFINLFITIKSRYLYY